MRALDFNIGINEVFSTRGDGYWSRQQKPVRCVRIFLNYVDDVQEFGELCVEFDTTTWDCRTDGLIYTDTRFENELRAYLFRLGFDSWKDISYSEQGMQTDHYVSLDVGKKFLESLRRYLENNG